MRPRTFTSYLVGYIDLITWDLDTGDILRHERLPRDGSGPWQVLKG